MPLFHTSVILQVLPNDAESANVKSVKRKLTDAYGADETYRKKLKQTESENETLISEQQDTNVRGASQHETIKQETRTRNKFQDVTNTPSKCSPCIEAYQSPTANLPNYVFNPEPRTPVGRVRTSSDKSTPDWLTQMRRQRSLGTPEAPAQIVHLDEKKTPTSKPRAEGAQSDTPKSCKVRGYDYAHGKT